MDFEQEFRVQLTMESPASNGKTWATMAMIALGAIPAAVLRLSGTHIDPILAAFIYGGGIVCSAFLLSWAAEVAEMDISGSLAIAILALVAVLPEYTIEAVLAWDAGASYNSVTQ